MKYLICYLKMVVFSYVFFMNFYESSSLIGNILDVKYWRCLLKKTYQCPDNDIKFYLYTPETGDIQKRIDVRSKIALSATGWDPVRDNAIIIHGFNSTHLSPPLKLLRNAYLSRKDYNVFMVEWNLLGRFPCYLSALSNMKLVSQCIAQLYAYIMDMGGSAKRTTCIGHSLGAHICGMISNHLDVKQYKIVGLDPAKPLIDRFASAKFKLTRDDAYQVQVIHTNAGLLGDTGLMGHVDFCVNGGTTQPGCKGHQIRRARCSHFQSVCYFAHAVTNKHVFKGKLCSSACPKEQSWDRGVGRYVDMGPDVPLRTRGQYCIQVTHNNDCMFH